MTVDAAEIEALRPLCEGAKLLSDGGTSYVYLPGLKITVGDTVRTLDALLRPRKTDVDGYTTRLYLSEPVPERQTNWTIATILGRTWHTWSWNNVPESLPLIQMLPEHVAALR